MNDISLSNLNITIVGLGLIGGTFAKCIRENIKVKNLWAVDIDEKVLSDAENLKIIDKGFIEPKFSLQNSDIIILCIYPNLTIKFIKDNLNEFKRNAIITDTSGIKYKVVEEVNSFIREDLDFIGGHPMAGKETSGFSNSDNHMFDNAQYILTPSKRSKIDNINLLKKMLIKLRFKSVNELTPKVHDNIIAYTSHLPHIIACSLVGNMSSNSKNCVGRSFKDAIRVADINSDLWSELLIENKDAVLHEVQRFIREINNIYKIIESNNQENLQIYLKRSCEKIKRMNI